MQTLYSVKMKTAQFHVKSNTFWPILLYYQDSDYNGINIQKKVVQNLVGTRDLSLLQIIQTNYEDHPALYLRGTSKSFPRDKEARHKANSLSPPSGKTKNARC